MRWLALVCLVAVAAVRLGEEVAPPAGPNEAARAEATLVAPPLPPLDVSANHIGPDAAAGQRTRLRSELPIDDAASPEAQQHFERELDIDAGDDEFMATSPSPEPL